ncbi:tryptophan synthase subunit alpha [Thiospirillum jenense]|uniref:Tryptophan synthase alpha chain n=1 Tax=Thiospirillum jenense TaxID=1653858 RepID=A0A839HPE0_9GAMM|nr:tryptophan synthase subunit alpha [Thiospirillum jenense]
MSRIATIFNQCRANNRTALIPFITAGDPNLIVSLQLMHRLVEAGADIIELGVPFSDPMADGPVIQRATERALAQGVRLIDVLALVKQFRAENQHTPVVLMGYLNPIECFGYAAFADAANQHGVDGVLIVDAPPEESHELVTTLRANNIDLVYLLAPTSDIARMEQINAVASGFVYYVSIKGVTGAAHLDVNEVAAQLAVIRQQIQLPLGVGFGIKDAATAAAVGQYADAVIVGSAIVSRIETLANDHAAMVNEVGAFVGELRGALG